MAGLGLGTTQGNLFCLLGTLQKYDMLLILLNRTMLLLAIL